MIEKTILQGLFCQYYNEMFHLARTLLYADEDAEDTVQDVFLRLMEADILPTPEKTRAYLMTAVRNGCINRIRQKSVIEQVKSLYPVEADSDMKYIEERLETLDAVCDYADNHLTEPHRTIFRLRFMEGMTLKDISQRIDMNPKTIFKYLSQSIQNIKEQFRH